MEMAMVGVIIATLGGLGMFILGMKMMTEGLQMSAGKRIKAILSAVSSNRVLGCLTGTVVTAMVQSSSATTVMLIGFVTAGLMTLQQAVGMILGANIGTTVTALLASLAVSGPNATAGLTIALVHLLFNVTGSALILPVSFMRDIPLSAARALANVATRSRRWAVIYVIILFYLIPAALVVISRALS
jgi:Na+/phosphate symporter